MAVINTMTADSRSATSVIPNGAGHWPICPAITPSRSTTLIRAIDAISRSVDPQTETQRPHGVARSRKARTAVTNGMTIGVARYQLTFGPRQVRPVACRQVSAIRASSRPGTPARWQRQTGQSRSRWLNLTRPKSELVSCHTDCHSVRHGGPGLSAAGDAVGALGLGLRVNAPADCIDRPDERGAARWRDRWADGPVACTVRDHAGR